ncbi:replication protein A 70 kDa DNA-binding subunit B-like [Apium graveolens]|uniref:replication protein A 70 kDa DNA-binding subunit B-like n=1 Tax=Apium graveolens TaxID=4045 RepID=UPI003D7B1626
MKIFDSIDSLHEGRFDWNLRVRLVREWDSYSSKARREFKGKNLLLVDDRHSRIHAFVWPNNIQDIKCEIVEGKIYTISNVQVKTYRNYSIKCIQSDKQIWFSSHTDMQVLENYDNMIPRNVFDFYNFSDVKDLPTTLPKSQLIDVIGYIIEGDYNIRQLTNNNDVEQIQLRFTMTDGRTSVKFCFWDDFATAFDKEVKAQHVRPIIAIVSSCRYGLFKEEVQLSNLPATRFFINYDHPAVEHFRERYDEGDFKIEDPTQVEIDKPKILTLATIQKLSDDYIKKHVMCKVKIVDVEEKSNWWHYIYTKCHLPVKELKHDFECEKCKRIVPVPEKSFKLCVNVEDDSGGAAILLYDREVQRISGKNVYEVFMEQKKSGKKDKFPAVLKNIEGKQCTCTIEIIENNVKQRSCLYTAVDILEGVDSVEYSKNHTGNTEFADGISELSENISTNQSISLDSFTPDTEKSTTTKPNKRKIEDVVVENMQELEDVGDQKESGKQVQGPVLLKNIKKEHD